MRGLRLIAAALGCWLAVGGAVQAAESKEDKLSSDQTQQQYTRKSITFVGTEVERGLRVPDDARQAIERAIRKQIELKRFDYNDVDIDKFGSIDAFIEALREYVRQRSQDRAAAEAEMDSRFKEARVYASDIDRIMESAYLYQIEIFVYRVKGMICPFDAATAARLECTPGVAGIKAVVNAKVHFYKADLSGQGGKGYSLLRTLKDTPAKGFTPFADQPPPKPRRPKLPPGASAEAKRRASENYQRALAEWRKAVRVYERRLPELEQRTRAKAVAKALSGRLGLAKRLATAMKRIPAFQLKSPVTAALSDGVEFMLGADDGLELDDTYEVAEFDQAGERSRSGWVKVRDVGAAKGSGEGTPSYAEKVSVSRSFAGGEQLFEYPMLKVDVGLHGVFEFTTGNLTDPDEDGFGLYPGAGMYLLYDMAPTFGWPEFWVGIEGDYLAVGETATGEAVSLIHAMVSLRKKWYINSFVFALGLRGGISYYATDEDDQGDTLIGGGGDLVLGIEYYVHPRFSVYLNAAGRFFTNPLTFVNADANQEMGAQANLGIRLGL